MSDERLPKYKLDLNLYLGLPQEQIHVETTIAEPSHRGRKRSILSLQEQDPDEDQGELVRHQVQNSVEEQVQDQFMELSRSALQQNIQPSRTSPHGTTSLIQSYGNYVTLLNVPASQPPNFSSPYQSSEQGQLFPTQAVTDHGETSLPLVMEETTIAEPSHKSRKRLSCVDDVEIKPPYPWATNRPATIKSRRYLSWENINVITGQVTCKSCDKEQTLEYNLEEKFLELRQFIVKEKEQMRHQSPKIWMHPKLPLCMTCNNEMKPHSYKSKNEINWLFLLLGQMLGCCTLEELKFFCKWNTQHCTGSKDRVLYLTYLALCKQLEPNGPFDP